MSWHRGKPRFFNNFESNNDNIHDNDVNVSIYCRNIFYTCSWLVWILKYWNKSGISKVDQIIRKLYKSWTNFTKIDKTVRNLIFNVLLCRYVYIPLSSSREDSILLKHTSHLGSTKQAESRTVPTVSVGTVREKSSKDRVLLNKHGDFISSAFRLEHRGL